MEQRELKGLAASIIMQAIKDYPQAVEKERNPEYDADGNIKVNKWLNKKELDKFFNSKWFEQLCALVNIDKAFIIKKVKEVAESEIERIDKRKA